MFQFVPVANHATFRQCTTSPREALARFGYHLREQPIMSLQQAANLLMITVEELTRYLDGEIQIRADMARRFLDGVNDVAYREQKKAFLASQKEASVSVEPAKEEVAPRTNLESKFFGLVKARVGRYGIISAADLAAALKGSERNVNHWRSGKHFPDVKTMKRVVDLLQQAA